MPTFLEARLSTKITAGATGGPRVMGRQKTYLPNGRLVQNFVASVPLHEFDVSHGLRNAADFQTVLDIFYVVAFTPYSGFRFRWQADYLATQANSRLTLISGANYQLQRVHTFGGVTILRDIKKPVTGTVLVYRTRSGAVTIASASIDYTTGIAIISGHVSGDTYTWEGQFDIPVTFVDDTWIGSLEVNTSNLHVQSSAIRLEELKLP